jgi:hypothetical protein
MAPQVTPVEIEDSTHRGKRPQPYRTDRRNENSVAKFNEVMQRSGGPLVDRFGEEAAAVMRTEMLDEYRRVIPEVPYIGGRRNIYSGDLEASAWFLAVYRVVVRHGGGLDTTGELIHQMVRLEIGRMPQAIRPLIRRYRFSRLRRRRLERAARRSQTRRYPGDWVFEVVDGEGEPFDFGIDMTECGIVKLFHDQGADELVPYLCELDYLMAEAIGIGLGRTRTLAWGCDRCDFRLTRDGETSAVWPPRFVEQTCGESEVEAETTVS